MLVTLALKDWKVALDAKTKQPKVVGNYAVMVGDKEIASQAFNEGYDCKIIAFSPELTATIISIEAAIKNELESRLQ